ncbi:hypothetical protein F0562_018913 [Nyssa sinensis]|uniref:Pectinesterase catalytic domain-containing protein n=1 Tax=Nyssa sinensis TaxID=561372 RepID=A0A5J4ZCL9_9ASTE|nr:hypothetical protein F0562_018913 [Nyssa sinensis]
MSGQGNMVTAQGRTDPNQNTGTSIQNCDIIASSDREPVKGSVKSYLGRPWQQYSGTVVMQSNIGDHIDPAVEETWRIMECVNLLDEEKFLFLTSPQPLSEKAKEFPPHILCCIIFL